MPRSTSPMQLPCHAQGPGRSTLALALLVLVGTATQYTVQVARSGEISVVNSAINLLVLTAAVALVLLLDRKLLRRAHTEQAVLQRAEGYRLLFENAAEAMMLLDEQGRLIDANTEAERLTGYCRRELLGMRATDLMTAAEAERGSTLHAQLLRLQRLTGEYTLRRRDATTVAVEFTAGRVAAGCYQLALRDISRRRQEQETLRRSHGELELQVQESEEALRIEAAARREADEARQAVFRAAPMAIVVLDPQGHVRMWSPAAVQLFGWTEREVIGRPYPLVPPDRQEEYRTRFERTLRGESTANVETQRRHKDGCLVDVGIAMAPMRRASAAVTGVLVVLTDIRERKALEQQIQQAQKLEVVGQLAAGVAHDFNNLLTVINGYSELLLTGPAQDNASRGLLMEIHKAGERATGLTRQLLSFSRKQAVQPRVLDLNAVITDVEKMLRRLIGEDITLQTALDANVGRVCADPGQMEQVLINLAVNARDAMPQGGKLSIATGMAELDARYAQTHYDVAAGRYVLLTVTDTGTGMAPEVQARIFEPFFTTKEPGKGTGLGLATVFGIVKQSGGHIEVTSEPGRGTTFSVYLPCVGATEKVLLEVCPATAVPRGTERVLLVEDEPGVRALASATLRECGYTVLEAGNGDEALAAAARVTADPVDLLVTDVIMPGLDGRRLAQRLQAQQPRLKVLYLSGYSETAIRRKGVQSGDLDYLLKPFTPGDLARTVRETLDRPAPSAADTRVTAGRHCSTVAS